ncbi:MAG TPA: hypothetical protein VKX25_13190 [Bryobacteraceae bacterium]|jgi:hypothetical protein|nr:hypothetical protein [Bryobacteraceae bacterium]
MSTPAQIAANRANSQLSTGPKTPEGKAKISHNAVKNALTGATVLLPADDAALYEQHCANTFTIWAPENHREKLLVQSIADTEWRLQRIPMLVAGVYALARLTHANLFADEPESIRHVLLETYITQTYARDLRNLSLQESRLTRYRDKSIAELKEIQAEREQRRKAHENRLHEAARIYNCYVEQNRDQTYDPVKLGFEFSIEEIKQKADKLPKSILQQNIEKHRREQNAA